MKRTDSRTYSVNDFRDWNNAGTLELAPKFQRRSVWTGKARSYLIDTILRDLPMPKVTPDSARTLVGYQPFYLPAGQFTGKAGK